MNEVFEKTCETMDVMNKEIGKYIQVLAVITNWIPNLPKEFIDDVRKITEEQKNER